LNIITVSNTKFRYLIPILRKFGAA